MLKPGLIFILCMVLFACKSKKTNGAEKTEGFDYAAFSRQFPSLRLPYQLADTALLKGEDPQTIPVAVIKPFIADSLTGKVFSKGTKIRYVPLGKIEVPKAETYFIVKVVNGSRKAALLLSFDKNKDFGAALPFLMVDNDPATTQTSVIDKNFTISRNVIKKLPKDIMREGKDVYVYNNDAKQYTLIMTDPLDEANIELINPIDTMPRKNKLAGDYLQNKKNIVSVRDGRRPDELMVFVHFEKDSGDCTGELKGDALLVASNKAVYRQGGDPCVMEFNFSPAAVTIKEQEGCGSHRGLRCLFEGTYPRKKELTLKTATKNKHKK